MAPDVSFTRATLPYPIFAVEFDPYNRGYLVVGGGGGEGRSGVPNQISVLDISNRATISIAVDIDLPRGEDSVQSLASLATKDGLVTFAGINSSQANQNAGKNDHLRSFDIKYPPRKRQKTEETGNGEKGLGEPIAKTSYFKPSKSAKSETYQRILRLSPAHPTKSIGRKRIGAIGTGLAKESEVVVFNATTAMPSQADIIAQINLPQGEEACDLDIANTGNEGEFSIAYCTDHGLHEQTIQYDFTTKKAEKTPKGPRCIYETPFPDTSEDPKTRPKFRSLRFLDPQNLIALWNKSNKGGAEVCILHLYPTGPAALLLQMSLPSHIKQAVSMDVCALDIDNSGARQIVVAVAGQDISIETYTLNYSRQTETFSKFKPFQSFKNVHQHQMTKIVFSPFHSPSRAPDPEPPRPGPNGESIEQNPDPILHPGPQYIRLASVSYGNTVVIDTFPLSPLDPKDKDSRYVLAHAKDERRQQMIYIALFSFIALVMALLVQSYLNPPAPGSTGLRSLLPPGAREFMNRQGVVAQDIGREMEASAAAIVDSSVSSSIPGKQRLVDLLAHHASSNARGRALVVRTQPEGQELSVDVHPDKEAYLREDTEAMHWEEMHPQQQAEWKRRLTQADQWLESQGEAVLKGILFSEYAGLVGQVGAEFIREL